MYMAEASGAEPEDCGEGRQQASVEEAKLDATGGSEKSRYLVCL